MIYKRLLADMQFQKKKKSQLSISISFPHIVLVSFVLLSLKQRSGCLIKKNKKERLKTFFFNYTSRTVIVLAFLLSKIRSTHSLREYIIVIY